MEYYTPTIDEIRVGIEFEMDDTWGGWTKLTLTKELFKNPLVPLGSGNDREPYYHKMRIKYLDKNDIEELGWSSNNKTYLEYGHAFIKGDKELLLWTNGEVPHIRISDTRQTLIVYFDGIIKNKSELNVLMKQLSIT